MCIVCLYASLLSSRMEETYFTQTINVVISEEVFRKYFLLSNYTRNNEFGSKNTRGKYHFST